jgi:TonB dependent receptor/CarboxypepD_reg-like domain/TonB-dependent Receptor Plug Domain
MKKGCYHIIICFLLATLSVSAQDKQMITGNFSGYHFQQLVHDIESQTDYFFYYDSTETDSLQINLVADHLTLKQVLDTVFQNTGFHFTMRNGDKVYISKNYQIQTTLPVDFFIPESADADTLQKTKFNAERAGASKAGLKSFSENKLFDIGSKNLKSFSDKAVLTGYIRDAETGEPLAGANISIDTFRVARSTDPFGYYNLSIPTGRHTIHISSAGMKDTRRQLMVYSDGKLNIELEEYVATLHTVIVSGEKTSNTRGVEMGVTKLKIQTIKQIPVVFGEVDILKVLLTLPGVTSVGEGSNGFNVRGGAADQNLVLYNEATVYNPSHLFGFFSAFDANLVKSVELYKSAIPEKYGGRLSSVLDVDVKDGNSKKWTGSAGISPLTSSVSIGGPIIKDKTSVIAGFRTTYSDWLLNQLPPSTYNNSRASFYDGSVHITHTINSRNTIYLMGYMSSDKFTFDADTSYAYSNANANIRWKHNFSNSSYAVFTTGIDHYQYSVSSTKVPVNAYKLSFDINQTYFRADFNYTPNTRHNISYGLDAVYYQLHPGDLTADGPKSLVTPVTLQREQALESALYLGDDYTVSEKLSVSAGLRYNIYNYLGPSTVYQYEPGLPRTTYRIVDSVIYPKGKIIQTYYIPDIRISARYSIDESSSVKVSLNSTSQFIHVISNTTNISPTDIWKLSDPNIQPQKGQQVSLGYYRNFKNNSIETSVEVYYKRIRDYLDYKNGATILLNPHLETAVFETEGKAYGIELLIKKTAGRINGWISYTYSRTFLKQDDPLAGELVNGGNYYPASFDKPNMVNLIGNYRFSHRYSASLNIVYSTGRPITLPIGLIHQGGSSIPIYSERNQYRVPDYFRTDLSINMEGNAKKNQTFHSSWSAGVYNLTGRNNVYSVYFVQENGKVKGYQLSIFGSLIPFITYNIRF